jgi:hypothetical protein
MTITNDLQNVILLAVYAIFLLGFFLFIKYKYKIEINRNLHLQDLKRCFINKMAYIYLSFGMGFCIYKFCNDTYTYR